MTLHTALSMLLQYSKELSLREHAVPGARKPLAINQEELHYLDEAIRKVQTWMR